MDSTRLDEPSIENDWDAAATIFNQGLDPFIVINNEDKIVFWNNRAQSLFGWSSAEMLGKSIFQNLLCETTNGDSDRIHSLRSFLESISISNSKSRSDSASSKAGSSELRLEVNALNRAGSTIVVESVFFPIKPGKEWATGIFMHDISSRKLWERWNEAQYNITEALAEQNDLVSTAKRVLEQICTAFDWEFGSLWIAEPQLNELSCTATWHSQSDNLFDFAALTRSLQFEPGMAVPGKVWQTSDHIVAEECTLVQNFIRIEGARKAGLRGLLAMPLSAGNETTGVIEFISKRQFSVDDRMLHALSTVCSQLGQFVRRNQVERDIERARDKALQSSHYKTEFVQYVSHEIRTPLGAIMGMLELLMRTPLTPDGSDMAQQAFMAARELRKILNDLLDLSRIEAGKMVIELSEFPVRTFVHDLRELVTPLFKPPNLEFLTIVEDSVSQDIKADPTRLRQIIFNLVDNAIKFSRDGPITLRVSNEVSRLTLRDMIKFEVIDHGMGIPQEKVSQLFTPFTQLDTIAARQLGGSGLGLSVCKALVRLMSGEIGCTSIVGKGSAFWFTIPVEPFFTSG